MKADKLLGKLVGADEKFGVGTEGLLILEYVMREWKAGEVTIMNLLANFLHTSPMTTHTNLKWLISKKILDTKPSKDDARIKHIKKGTKFNAFIAYLEE